MAPKHLRTSALMSTADTSTQKDPILCPCAKASKSKFTQHHEPIIPSGNTLASYIPNRLVLPSWNVSLYNANRQFVERQITRVVDLFGCPVPPNFHPLDHGEVTDLFCLIGSLKSLVTSTSQCRRQLLLENARLRGLCIALLAKGGGPTEEGELIDVEDEDYSKEGDDVVTSVLAATNTATNTSHCIHTGRVLATQAPDGRPDTTTPVKLVLPSWHVSLYNSNKRVVETLIPRIDDSFGCPVIANFHPLDHAEVIDMFCMVGSLKNMFTRGSLRVWEMREEGTRLLKMVAALRGGLTAKEEWMDVEDEDSSSYYHEDVEDGDDVATTLVQVQPAAVSARPVEPAHW